MSYPHFSKILCTLTLFLVCAGMMQAQSATPLVAAPTSVTVTYQKPSTPQSPSPTVKITATTANYFTIDAATVPIWLNLDVMNGTANSTGVTITLTPNSVCGQLGAGSYFATLKLKVVGANDLSLPVTLVVSNPAPTLSNVEGTTQTKNWAKGSAYPTYPLTFVSTNEPIGFSLTPSVTTPSSPANWLKVDHTSGVAYSWGTPITVSFLQAVLDAAAVGDVLSAKVTVTPVGGSPFDVTFAITVTPPAAGITLLYPSETPVQATPTPTDALSVVVTGTGFVSGTNQTVVKIGSTTMATADVNVVNANTMILNILADPNLKAAASLVISVQNTGVGSPVTATLTVTDNPIIYSVTNSASYVNSGPGVQPNLVPYGLISIFGDNFGPTGGAIVTSTPDTTYGLYPAVVQANAHDITVNFAKADGTPIAAAPLIFASNNQINAMVPSGVAGNATVKITVTYNSLTSSVFVAKVVTADPGIFTTNSSGTGQAAILHSDYSANSSTNKAVKGTTTVLIYLAGMGTPNSTATNVASTTAPTFPKSCISPAAYMSSVNTHAPVPSPLWVNLDGAILESSLFAKNVFAPCFASTNAVTVTIGGKAATVSYAGWVADSVTGLYQVNAAVPATVTPGTAVPVVVTMGAVSSQPGVTMAVQ